MMKLSIMTLNMFINAFIKYRFDQDMEDLSECYQEMMELLRDTGYEAVDITSFETTIFTIDIIKSVLKANNLKVGSYIYMDKFSSMDEDGFAERVEKAKKSIDDAILLETKVVMLQPQAQEDIANFTPEEIRGQLIRHWKPVVEYALGKDIHVVVEDTPDLKMHFCTTEELQEVLSAVPGLEVVYDSGNMLLIDEDPVTYYDTFADKTAHIHLKDMRNADSSDRFADTAKDGSKMTVAPTGTGMVNIKTVIEHVKAHGYDGYLTVEFAVDEDNDYRKSLIRSREYVEALI